MFEMALTQIIQQLLLKRLQDPGRAIPILLSYFDRVFTKASLTPCLCFHNDYSSIYYLWESIWNEWDASSQQNTLERDIMIFDMVDLLDKLKK